MTDIIISIIIITITIIIIILIFIIIIISFITIVYWWLIWSESIGSSERWENIRRWRAFSWDAGSELDPRVWAQVDVSIRS